VARLSAAAVSRDMALVSRILGRSRMMVVANSGAHTCVHEKENFHIDILCTHIPCVIIIIARIFGGKILDWGETKVLERWEYTRFANYSVVGGSISLWDPRGGPPHKLTWVAKCRSWS